MYFEASAVLQQILQRRRKFGDRVGSANIVFILSLMLMEGVGTALEVGSYCMGWGNYVVQYWNYAITKHGLRNSHENFHLIFSCLVMF